MSIEDPKGTALVEELEKRIRDAGLAGYVVVISPERSHWRYVLDAPWTALSYDRKTGQLRLRLKSREFRTGEQARRTLELTLHVVLQFRDLLIDALMGATMLKTRIDEEGIRYEHKPYQDFKPPPTT